MPVPPHLWHLTTLSPFLSVPFPSQFLQGFFFSPTLFRMESSGIRSWIPIPSPPTKTVLPPLFWSSIPQVGINQLQPCSIGVCQSRHARDKELPGSQDRQDIQVSVDFPTIGFVRRGPAFLDFDAISRCLLAHGCSLTRVSPAGCRVRISYRPSGSERIDRK